MPTSKTHSSHKPLKRYGQNFLTDKNIIEKIVNEINSKEGEEILEIGPGKGALTRELLKSGAKIYAVEIDKYLVDELKKELEQANLINADVLKLNLVDLFTPNRIRVVGNIPYNITSPILFKLIENRTIVKDAVLMMQDEVAKRLVAKPNTKDYGILSIALNYFGSVEYCFRISKNVFFPKPKVFSALVHIYFNGQISPLDALFVKVVKAAFNHRRKTLKNSLTNSIFKDCDFKKIKFDLSRRAESLSVAEFTELTNEINNCLQRI